jgi:hypothetical protein
LANGALIDGGNKETEFEAPLVVLGHILQPPGGDDFPEFVVQVLVPPLDKRLSDRLGDPHHFVEMLDGRACRHRQVQVKAINHGRIQRPDVIDVFGGIIEFRKSNGARVTIYAV